MNGTVMIYGAWYGATVWFVMLKFFDIHPVNGISWIVLPALILIPLLPHLKEIKEIMMPPAQDTERRIAHGPFSKSNG